MNGKETIMAAMKLQEVDRIPWVPFVGCHGGLLIDVNAEDYLRSEENIVRGAAEAVRRYKPDGLPVVFDLQIEAEILGCDLMWAEENPPAVSSHPLRNGKTLADLDIPKSTDGRLPIVLNATRKIKANHPDIALYGLITGPFTLALHLYGSDIFLQMFQDEAYTLELIDFCKRVCLAMADYHIDAGCDIVAVVDPMTSQIGPKHFKQFVTSAAAEIFEHIKRRDRLGSFFVCGHAQQNIEAMCDCGPDNVSVDENIPLDYVRDICLERNISFGGNLQLTVVLLLGEENDALRNSQECIEIGGNTGFILAPGCDLPYSTPPENLEAVARYIHDPYQQEIVQTLERHEKPENILDMSDYGQTDKVIVDIITLDSESCAPCQYMVEAVKAVAPHFESIVEWREHKIKYRESLKFMTSLMVKNIPTICIDGQITFVSRIPPRDELIAAIQKRLFEKLSYKIRTKKGSILILGKDEAECAELKPAVEQALHELGADVSVDFVTDEQEILSYGVMSTPAVVTARYTVKSERETPSVAVVKEWIKDLV
ncbi:MAG: uroporphyrinogen decarboxylase [Proteobacteria bacterium]|nr:uroporphyrinogen decarboxylase [Pseudomonadota bacterium]